MGNLEEEGDFGGESVVPEGKAVLWPWCAPLSCQVCFAGLILCNFCPPYWGFQYFFVCLFFKYFLLTVWKWMKASWMIRGSHKTKVIKM